MESSVARRLENKIERVTESGCWLWLGTLNNGGYGKISVQINRQTKQAYAHRVSYELLKGNIPAGLDIDHVCRVRCCVNPSHLRAVTRSENLLNTGKRKLHEKLVCKHGHAMTDGNSYVRPNGQVECRACKSSSMRKFMEKR